MKKGLLIAATLASPLIWFASLGAQFALAPWVCPQHSNLPVLAVAAVAILLDVASGAVAWRQWSFRPEGTGASQPMMPRWLAMSGVALSGAFLLVIAAQAIPDLILRSCE